MKKLNKAQQQGIKGGDLNWRCLKFCKAALEKCISGNPGNTAICDARYDECVSLCNPYL